jgi:ABC-type Fe3+-siderophore transport system permease subunit
MLLVVFAGITATLSLFGFLFLQLYGMFAFLGIALVWYIVYTVVSSRNIEYEYCITDGILDIDIITAKRKRKSLATIVVSNAEIIAPASIEYIEQFNKNGIVFKIDASMKNNKIMDFFIIFPNKNGQITRLVFTPDENVYSETR